MPTPFDELRKLAAQRRDKACEAARREYDEAIQDIAALEKKLVLRGVPRARNKQTKKLVDTIVSVLPDDRAFTLDDVCGWVREADPERSFTKPTIRTNLHRLMGEGVLKRVTTAAGNQRATFAVASSAPSLRRQCWTWQRKLHGSPTAIPSRWLIIRRCRQSFSPVTISSECTHRLK